MRYGTAWMMLALCALVMSGCTAAVKSHRVGFNTYASSGLVYHLPLKLLKLQVTVEGTKQTPDVLLSEAYGDPSSTYVLEVSRSQFGDNALDIGISEKGLLSTADAQTTSRADDVLKNVASLAASSALMAEHIKGIPKNQTGVPSGKCIGDGIYSVLIDVRSPGAALCEIEFQIIPLGPDATLNRDDANNPVGNQDKHAADICTAPDARPNDCRQVNGIYYRQFAPFQIIATRGNDDDNPSGFLVMAPDPRQVNMLPVPSSLFADNHTYIKLVDGMPIEYKPTVNSEVVGVLKIPADVIGAYFGAIGNLFKAFGDSKSAQASALGDVAALKLKQYKTDLCLKAIASRDDKSVSTACTSP
ncbi:hypothetical protein [Dyella koreensis]|uniref:Lipoprotein n=1 Tax=Dyella koreensis TaxID=311235 RepID=A0ABW8KAR5_9GAMM